MGLPHWSYQTKNAGCNENSRSFADPGLLLKEVSKIIENETE